MSNETYESANPFNPMVSSMGEIIRESISSSVDFPALFCPMMPTTSP
jgi:hypothetical protein